MQLRYLKTFAAVASSLNFTRAAEEVHLAQSSVTEQIQALEADLGAALFDRTGRKLRLTPAGLALQDYAARLLCLAEEMRAAVAGAAGLAGGTLAIGGLETLCATRLPPLLAGFRREHPAIDLKLSVAGSGALVAGVRNGTTDACFIFGDAPEEAGLHAVAVARERLVVIVPPDHPLAGRNRVSPEDLADTAFLVTETGCVYRRMFETAFPAASPTRPRLAGEFSSILAIRRLVEAGVGCALVPDLVAAEAQGAVATLSWADDADGVAVVMVSRRRRVQPPALRLFLDMARTHFSGLTPVDARPRHAAPSP